jgi:hypothetical protein
VEESIAVRRELLPPNHLSIAGGLDNLARIYLGERRLSDARRTAEESLQIYQAALPLNHPRVREIQNLMQRIQNADAREHRLLVTLLQGALATAVGLVVLIGANLWAERRHLADNNAGRSVVAQALSAAGTIGLFGGAAFVVAIGAGWFVADYLPSLADDRNTVRNLGKLTSIIGIWLAAITSQVLTNVGRVALGMPTHKIVYFHWSAVRPRIPLANGVGSTGNQRPGLQGEDGSARWFAAMEYYALILNRTYKVFVTDRMLCGGKVRGLVSNSPGVSQMVDQAQWVQTSSAKIYDRLDVTSRDFLAWNSANFQIPWSDIARIEYRPDRKCGMGSVPHSGRLNIALRSGRTRELILLGAQDGEVLKRQLEQAASGQTVPRADGGLAQDAREPGGPEVR